MFYQLDVTNLLQRLQSPDNAAAVLNAGGLRVHYLTIKTPPNGTLSSYLDSVGYFLASVLTCQDSNYTPQRHTSCAQGD